jgi:hypothetical protein
LEAYAPCLQRHVAQRRVTEAEQPLFVGARACGGTDDADFSADD